MPYSEERWYHGYLYLITCTGVLSVIGAWLTEWTTTPFIMVFGSMAIFSACAFFAESAVMGPTAKAGSFFMTSVTCFLVAKYLPWTSLS